MIDGVYANFITKLLDRQLQMNACSSVFISITCLCELTMLNVPPKFCRPGDGEGDLKDEPGDSTGDDELAGAIASE